jgi:hypothetical protein
MKPKSTPELTDLQKANLLEIAALHDEDINCFDIPEVTDFSGCRHM